MLQESFEQASACLWRHLPTIELGEGCLEGAEVGADLLAGVRTRGRRPSTFRGLVAGVERPLDRVDLGLGLGLIQLAELGEVVGIEICPVRQSVDHSLEDRVPLVRTGAEAREGIRDDVVPTHWGVRLRHGRGGRSHALQEFENLLFGPEQRQDAVMHQQAEV
ncbi:hypothetical protein D3C71_1209930 [compost metagenome]